MFQSKSRCTLNLCDEPKDDGLEWVISDTDQAIARHIRASLAQQMAEKELANED